LERKVDQLEEELNYLSAKISGKVLHPQHYIMLIARRNYKYISNKMLISMLATCPSSKREEQGCKTP
jgi:hypothetical protein